MPFIISFASFFQGRGYGTEALTWLVEQAFLRYGLNKVSEPHFALCSARISAKDHFLPHQVEIAVFAWNVEALKSYKKVGFLQEGLLRQSMWQEGAFRDEVLL